MSLTPEQVLALAPDASSAAAGKKLSGPRDWKLLGRSAAAIVRPGGPGDDDAGAAEVRPGAGAMVGPGGPAGDGRGTGAPSVVLWGECQGSALYQVRVDLGDLSVKCSCPSRKFPCKHGLGLLLMHAGNAEAIPEREEPEWVTEWRARRAGAAAKKEAKREAREEEGQVTPVDGAAQARRAGKRQARVEEGAAGLSLWLSDLLRRGLSGLEAEGPAFWESQASRLVDAQASGLAARVRALGELPGATRDWPALLAREIGRLGLLLHALERLPALPPALQADVRQMVGFPVSLEEVASGPDAVADRWTVLGQWVDEEERVRTQRSWLRGAASRRDALVLQFSAGGAPFPEPLVPGSAFEGTLAFWPGAVPQRALVKERRGTTAAAVGLPAASRVDAFLSGVAAALALQPFLERFPAALLRVVPFKAGDDVLVADEAGDALPLFGAAHHRLLAVSGGRPVDLAGEWHRERLRPLGLFAEGRYVPLAREGSWTR